MDYRTLLKKYIRHVGYVEGDSFISPALLIGYAEDTGLTPEEIAELEVLDAEILTTQKD
jgi:hypothetical protein